VSLAGAQDWEAVAARLARALTGIRDTRSWRLRLPSQKCNALDQGALEALQAFEALRDPGRPTDAERLAKRLLDGWDGSCCEEIDDGEWLCIDCDATGPTAAHVPHKVDCIGALAERLMRGATA
jgi:hypothetical protein